MTATTHVSMTELEAGLAEILRSPKDNGVLELIVRRPQAGEREVLETANLNFTDGLTGDNWKTRGTVEKPANPACQITIMNSRAIAVIAREKTVWPLAGDQLYVDLDISTDNLPAGARLAIGSVIVEISPHPHTGCKKFLARFGHDAVEFVNSTNGKQLRLRGLNARVVQSGTIQSGDKVRKLD